MNTENTLRRLEARRAKMLRTLARRQFRQRWPWTALAVGYVPGGNEAFFHRRRWESRMGWAVPIGIAVALSGIVGSALVWLLPPAWPRMPILGVSAVAWMVLALGWSFLAWPFERFYARYTRRLVQSGGVTIAAITAENVAAITAKRPELKAQALAWMARQDDVLLEAQGLALMAARDRMTRLDDQIVAARRGMKALENTSPLVEEARAARRREHLDAALPEAPEKPSPPRL